MNITKKSVYRHLIRPLKNKGYNVLLVGSISKNGYSKKDIDILLDLSTFSFSKADKIFVQFEKDLKIMKWDFVNDNETEEYGIFHCYSKKGIGLDIFIGE